MDMAAQLSQVILNPTMTVGRAVLRKKAEAGLGDYQLVEHTTNETVCTVSGDNTEVSMEKVCTLP
jgi:hypothetical protein